VNARSRRARHAFEVMRGVLITAERMLGRGLIQAVEEVCVEDLVCPAGRLGDLRTALGMVRIWRRSAEHCRSPPARPLERASYPTFRLMILNPM
jgi:hypothetical protein